MFVLYIKSVIVWMIMIWASIYINKDKIIEKGWLDGAKKKGSAFVAFVAMAAIPVVRIVFVVVPFIMANKTKEEFYEWIEEL